MVRDDVALTRPGPGRRTARLVPPPVGAVPKHAVWRVRPAAVEAAGQDRVRSRRSEQPLGPVGVNVGLGSGEEPRAHRNADRAGGDGGLRAAHIGDAAGGDHGDRECPGELADQHEHGRLTLDVAAGLHPLDENEVASGGGRRMRLLDRAGLRHDQPAGGMDAGDQIGADAPREQDQLDALGQGDLEPLLLLEREHEVDAERPVGGPPDLANLRAQLVRLGPRRPQRADPAGLGHRRGERRRRRRPDRRLHHRHAPGEPAVDRGSHYAFSTAPASGHLAASSARFRTPSFR